MRNGTRLGLAVIVMIVGAVCTPGCTEEEDSAPVNMAPAPVQPVVQKPATPPREPRPSLDAFIEMVKKNDPKYARYYVAYKFYPEHTAPLTIWVSNLKWDTVGFRGKIHNPPAGAIQRQGENGFITREEISDWMMVTKDKRMVGGESLRAERAALQPHLRAAFDAKWDLKFD